MYPARCLDNSTAAIWASHSIRVEAPGRTVSPPHQPAYGEGAHGSIKETHKTILCTRGPPHANIQTSCTYPSRLSFPPSSSSPSLAPPRLPGVQSTTVMPQTTPQKGPTAHVARAARTATSSSPSIPARTTTVTTAGVTSA